MQKFLADLIKLNHRVSHQGIDQQPPEPMFVNTVQPTENRDSLIQPALSSLDHNTLCLFKVMDLAG